MNPGLPEKPLFPEKIVPGSPPRPGGTKFLSTSLSRRFPVGAVILAVIIFKECEKVYLNKYLYYCLVLGPSTKSRAQKCKKMTAPD